jgi:hypothetical protein
MREPGRDTYPSFECRCLQADIRISRPSPEAHRVCKNTSNGETFAVIELDTYTRDPSSALPFHPLRIDAPPSHMSLQWRYCTQVSRFAAQADFSFY